MPLLPSSLTEPAWVEFAALIGHPERPEFAATHPWGCHRRRIPDRVVFEHLLAALVHGSGYERIATPGCSDRTIRRRLHEWAQRGLGEALLRATLAGYDQMIGLELENVAVDGSITKAPCGGETAGRSPVDRGKQGMKRSVATDGDGIPLGLVAARANDHDSPLLEPTLAAVPDTIGPLPDLPCMHLDAGYDSKKTRDLLECLGYHDHIATKVAKTGIRDAWVNSWLERLESDIASQATDPHHRVEVWLAQARAWAAAGDLERARRAARRAVKGSFGVGLHDDDRQLSGWLEWLAAEHMSVHDTAREVQQYRDRLQQASVEGNTVTPEELLRYCAEKMPYFMVPRYLDVVEDFPRTPTAKVEKYKLRAAGPGPTTWDREAHGWRVTREGLARTVGADLMGSR